MRNVILGQCTGALASLTFSNGLLLLFLQSAGFKDATILLLISIYGIVQPTLLLPFAYFGERNRRRMIIAGGLWTTLGFGLLATTPCAFWRALGAHAAMIPAAGGIAVFALGVALVGAPWFAILSDLVPAHMRGSFLGKLRLSWQLVGLGFGVLCTFLLGLGHQQVSMLQIIMLCCVTGLALRISSFRSLPQVPNRQRDDTPFREAVWSVIRIPGYSGFCCYVFLLTLVTASAATLFALIEKNAIGFHDRGVVWMGNLLAAGAVGGFYLAGLLVDRIGTRPVFLICHFGYAAIFFCIIMRDILPLPTVAWMGALNVAYGLIAAGVSVAVSTEMMTLAPSFNKSLSTALCSTLQIAGGGLASLFSAGAINLGILNVNWTILGHERSAYDTILLINGLLVVMLVVALGLVPSVIAKPSMPETRPGL